MALTDSDFEERAEAPRKVTTVEGTVTERPISDMIKADQHIAARNTPDTPLHGLRVTRFKPSGAA
jgi:hypothetical protein